MNQNPSDVTGSQRYSMAPFIGVDVRALTVVVLRDYLNLDYKYDYQAYSNFMLTHSFSQLKLRIRPTYLIEFENGTEMIKVARERHIKLIEYMIKGISPKHKNHRFIPGMTLQNICSRAKAQQDCLPYPIALATDDPRENNCNKDKPSMDISIFLIFLSNLFYDMNREMAKLIIYYFRLHRMHKLTPTMAKIYGGFKRVLSDFHQYIKSLKLTGGSREVFLKNDPYYLDLDH